MTTLSEAAQAYLDYETEIARESYKTWNGTEWIWNDQVWEESEPQQFKLVKALRKAIAEAVK